MSNYSFLFILSAGFILLVPAHAQLTSSFFCLLISFTLDKEVYLSLCQSSHDRVALFYLWWRVTLVSSVRFPRSPWVLASSWQTGEEWAQEHHGGSFYGPGLEVAFISSPHILFLPVLKTEQNKICLSTQKPNHFPLICIYPYYLFPFFFLLPKFLSRNSLHISRILIY